MKKIFILALFFIISFNSFAQQSFYTTITKSEFDSLVSQTWYKGRVFFRNDSYVDGWIHRVPEEALIKFKLYDGDDKSKLKDIQTDILTAHRVEGFYNTYEKDTAWFVFLDAKNGRGRKKPKAFRILINDPEGISLLRISWLEAAETRLNLFNSNAYEIRWMYYVWKDMELNQLFLTNDVKKFIKDDEEALAYYKKNKRKFEHGDKHYGYLSNLIHIYNKTYEKANQ